MTTYSDGFRIPKPKSSNHYEQEITRVMSDFKQNQSFLLEPQFKKEEITSYKQLFEEDRFNFDTQINYKQMFLGNQQIPVKNNGDQNAHFIIDDEPRVVLTIARHAISIPISEVMAIALYRTTRHGFCHAMILNLTSQGSSFVIEKFQSLKYRLDKYQVEGMDEEDLAVQRNTVILVLNERNIFGNSQVAILRCLGNFDKCFQVNEDTWARIFRMIKDKLERNCMVIELIIETLSDFEMEDIMETLGLSWLKNGMDWEMKDRSHFLILTPTLFMENTAHGIVEISYPHHWMRPLVRKRMLSFSDDVVIREKDPKLQDDIVNCPSNSSDSANLIANVNASNEETTQVQNDSDDDEDGDLQYGIEEYESDLGFDDNERAYTVQYVEHNQTPFRTSLLASLLNDGCSTSSDSISHNPTDSTISNPSATTCSDSPVLISS